MKRAGSKSRLVQHLLPHIAAVAHECFVEPFCGTCSVLMAKPRSKVEVVNDTDGELVNALRQIQHHLPEVLKQLRFVPNSRDEFLARRSQPGLTEIQRAASYLYLNNISFSGNCRDYGVARKGGGGACTPSARITRQAQALHDRLERVSVERLDWQRCVELYDSPATLFFCDPPYIGGNVRQYASWTSADVRQLRRVLSEIAGSWIVTLNDSAEVRAIFTGCKFTPFSRALTYSNNSKTAGTYREVIITP
jgi:DNA adenine methylase